MTTTEQPPALSSAPARPPDPDPPAATPALLRWGDTVLGAAFATEEAATNLLAGLRRVAARRRRDLAGFTTRGAVERARWQHRIDGAARSAVDTAARSPVIDRVVDHQLERILRPVVLAVLDDVLLLLENEPERIQLLIRGQRESMVDELVARLRTGAQAGDTVVDRLTFRVFHRGARPVPGPPDL